jgi:hypothetical protein
MARIIGSIDSVAPKVPSEILTKIQMVATYKLTNREATLFTYALEAINSQLKHDNKLYKELRNVVIIFTKDGSYCVQDDYSMGSLGTYAVFSIQAWRDKEWSELNIITVFVEELCHHFWGIKDEEEVKYKVLEVINRIFKQKLQFEDIFLPTWKEGYPHIYGNQK